MLTDNPNWWEEAKERGRKKNAFEWAMSKSFEQLNENEQEKIFEEMLTTGRSLFDE